MGIQSKWDILRKKVKNETPYSTCTALLTITDEILKRMNDSEITLLSLIDLSRFFDVVDHEALLKKLELYQITTGWFRSYLSGHVQRMKVGESLSEPLPITIGTFQGTCLGPLLYKITSNDISCLIPTELDGFKITTVRYADDTRQSQDHKIASGKCRNVWKLC